MIEVIPKTQTHQVIPETQGIGNTQTVPETQTFSEVIVIDDWNSIFKCSCFNEEICYFAHLLNFAQVKCGKIKGTQKLRQLR